MKSWRIGEFLGIGVYVHWSFLIVPLWVGLSAISGGAGVSGAIASIATILAIFGCVVLHELGHAMAARRFGVGTRSVTLYPIGGVANLERIPRNPWQEFVIAIAGPAVNVVIAAALLSLLVFGGGLEQVGTNIYANPMVANLLIANVALVLFNLLPAFPMDGGRILRAILASRMKYRDATRVAASVGRFMALAFALLGLFSLNFTLLLVAGFIYFAASQELRVVEWQDRRGVVPIADGVDLITPTNANSRQSTYTSPTWRNPNSDSGDWIAFGARPADSNWEQGG